MRGAERRFGGDVGMSRYGRYGGGELPGRRGGGECSLADSRRKGELPRRAEQPAREGRKERGREARRPPPLLPPPPFCVSGRGKRGGEAARAAAVLRAGGNGRRGQDGGPGPDPPLPPAETKVYVGNLGTGAGKGELERAFSYYGPLRTVWIARNPPGFAFVEFEDPRDAEDAVLGLDGKYVCAETPWLLCQQHLTFSCSCQQYQLL